MRNRHVEPFRLFQHNYPAVPLFYVGHDSSDEDLHISSLLGIMSSTPSQSGIGDPINDETT